MAPPPREDVLGRFGSALADARRNSGLTQEQLAEASGLHRTFIGSLERGERNPTITTLVALAAGLGTTADKLLRRARL
ncbi:MAG: helix-turn-helix domain-containing protein [Actinomycetota bacterium]|nr:helix-turn-helix domain-containing protein [Actinomycetota bacterium]